jgi:uncharacterized repeat protein (TIGR01451 family)
VQVGLFEPGQTSPLITAITQNTPYLGDYEFNNVPDGTYYIALMNESLFPTVTQPGINAGLLSGYNYVYSITVTGGQVADNNNFGVGLTVPDPQVDIAVNKTVDISTLNSGYVTYTITMTNNGTDDAHNLVLSDILPAGVTYSIFYVSPASYDPGTGEITLSTLNAGQTVTLQIVANIDKGACGKILNEVHLISLDETDLDSSNNSSSASFTIDCDDKKEADISVKKTVRSVTNNHGWTQVVYRIAVTNNGPGNATSVTIEDPLSSYYYFQSATATMGSASYISLGHKVVWTIAPLNAGQTAYMYITVVVNVSFINPTLIKNKAAVTNISGVIDSDPANNSSSVGVTVGGSIGTGGHGGVDHADPGSVIGKVK